MERILSKQGQALRILRKQANLTINVVVQKMGKSKVWLSEIENGKKNIYFDDALKLCKIYDVSIDELSKLIHNL